MQRWGGISRTSDPFELFELLHPTSSCFQSARSSESTPHTAIRFNGKLTRDLKRGRGAGDKIVVRVADQARGSMQAFPRFQTQTQHGELFQTSFPRVQALFKATQASRTTRLVQHSEQAEASFCIELPNG